MFKACRRVSGTLRAVPDLGVQACCMLAHLLDWKALRFGCFCSIKQTKVNLLKEITYFLGPQIDSCFSKGDSDSYCLLADAHALSRLSCIIRPIQVLEQGCTKKAHLLAYFECSVCWCTVPAASYNKLCAHICWGNQDMWLFKQEWGRLVDWVEQSAGSRKIPS